MSRGICLVIENDEDIAGLITLILTQEGFEVRAVRTRAAALRQAREPNLVLITLETILPDNDGLNIVRDLRDLTQTPLLMLTGRASTADQLNGLAAGAAIYLTKPFRLKDLRSAANELCPTRVDSTSVAPIRRNAGERPASKSASSRPVSGTLPFELRRMPVYAREPGKP